MERVRRTIFAAILGLACAAFGYAWLAETSQEDGARRDVADLTSMVAWQPARPILPATQAPELRQLLPSLPQVTVALRDGLLTVKAHGAPLKEILSEITRSVGVTFAVSDDAGEPLSVDLGPRPVKEVISGLLDQASYGHAFVESAGNAGQPRLERVFLVKRGTTLDRSGQLMLAIPAISGLTKPVENLAPPDEAAMQQQRAVDALFDACKAQSQGCDTS